MTAAAFFIGLGYLSPSILYDNHLPVVSFVQALLIRQLQEEKRKDHKKWKKKNQKVHKNEKKLDIFFDLVIFSINCKDKVRKIWTFPPMCNIVYLLYDFKILYNFSLFKSFKKYVMFVFQMYFF